MAIFMKTQTINQELFENMPIPRAVAKLAIPSMIASLVMIVYNMTDTYFVGMLNAPVQSAAVTLAFPVILSFFAATNLFGVGGSSMMSRALGRKDFDTVQKSSAFAFFGALSFAIVISLVCLTFNAPLLSILGATDETIATTREYLFWTVICGAVPSILNIVLANLVRSEGASFHASVGTMCGCVMNIALDPIFILPWGLGMGAAGAGFATFLSNCVACVYYFILIFLKRKKTYVCINPKKLSLEKEIVVGTCAVGIPAAIQNLLNVTGTTVLNNFTAGYGADAVAAMGIAHRLFMMPLQLALGCGQGVLSFIGYNYSAKNYNRMRGAVFFTAKIIEPATALLAVIFFVASPTFISLFIKNAGVVSYGAAFLRIMSVGMPFMTFDFLSVGIFQALGLGRYALIYAGLRKIVLEIPALFLFDKIFSVNGLAVAQPFTEFVLATVSIFILRKILYPKDEVACQ